MAISNGAVREEHLRAILDAEGTSWESALHISATTSLARTIRSSGSVALPIATLLDLIVLPGLTGEMALPLLGFPGPSMLTADDPQPYDAAVSAWQQLASGRRLRLGIQFDDYLRKFVRTEVPEQAVGRVLVRSRRELSRTVHTLIAAGVHPADLSPNDTVARTAATAWARLESDIPALTAVRDDLWINFEDFESQSSPHAQDLRTRIEQALDCAFGATEGRRVIVHHGFYFFTPPQWALFQLLRRIPTVDQIFVIHDDGNNRAFETWRRFFNEKWSMPIPRPAQVSSGVTHAAAAFRDALGGERIDDHAIGQNVRILECRSPAELVREWRLESLQVEERGRAPKRFAADAKSVERFVRRLGKDSGSGPVDLAQLPIGSFLLAIHDCIKPVAKGRLAVTLSSDALIDIVASGYLDSGGQTGSPHSDVAGLRRALPFFRGCISGEQWRERAMDLHRLVIAEVTPLGGRDTALSDVDRIRTAVDNPLRLVPWGDLSPDEAATVAAVVTATVALVNEIASRERVALKDHLQFLRRKLQQGMQDLPEEERQQITAKVDGFAVGLEDEIDVDGLIDVVAMLLGRTAEFDATGDSESPEGAVGELRSLDALGFRRLKQGMHVANLADGTFPSRVPAVGWPFRADDMRAAAASVDPVIVEILEARAENAALSDLYLLWLALDGVEPEHPVTFSWISNLGGEPRNPSSILSLLTVPKGVSDAVANRAGGLKVDSVIPAGDMAALTERPEPLGPALSEAQVREALLKLDSRATASSRACARRFAIEWALGPSAAFQSDHHQTMLFGNVVGALVRLTGLDVFGAVRACNDLWRHLTIGQRASSLAKAVVKPAGRSANGLWILTLDGRKGGAEPLDRAYQAAVTGVAPDPKVMAPPNSQYLPPGVDNAEVCAHCPVRPRCAVWVERDT